MSHISLQTKPMRTVEDLHAYISAINSDDFDSYCCYYARNIKV